MEIRNINTRLHWMLSDAAAYVLSMDEALVDLPDGRCRCRICNTIVGSHCVGKRHYEVMHTYLRKMLCSLCGAIQKNKYSFGCHLNLKHAIKGKDVVSLYGEYIWNQEAFVITHPLLAWKIIYENITYTYKHNYKELIPHLLCTCAWKHFFSKILTSPILKNFFC